MPRLPRIQVAGGCYHVATRGNNRQRTFVDRDDFLRFLAGLQRTVERYGWICHSYCLMGNHVHLVLETPEATLAAGMQQLQCRYAKGFNKRYGRTGHVFGNRYFSLHLETDSHLLELSRYVVLNPVRAGVCPRPEEWPWSSYSAFVGLAPRPAFLTTEWLLAQFGRDEEEARRQFERFVAQGLEA